MSSICIFNAVKKQSGTGFIADALFGNFAYLQNLYTVVELHTNIVLIHFESQPTYAISCIEAVHTHVIGYCNPSVRISELVSHTTYVVCVNFIHKWRDLQFKVDSERQIFEKHFTVIFLYS